MYAKQGSTIISNLKSTEDHGMLTNIPKEERQASCTKTIKKRTVGKREVKPLTMVYQGW